MTLPTAPPAPNPVSATFGADALTFTQWMEAFANALPDEIDRWNAIGYGSFTATSTSSVTIGTGAKTLTVETGKGFVPGQMLMVARTSAPTNYMTGQVTSYDAGTGALVLDAQIVAGTGTFTDWTISVTAVVTTDTPIGTITSVAKTPPTDGTWLACDGSVYLQASYAALYAELGLLANSPNSAGDWTQRVLPTSTAWQSVTYGNGVFVAVAQSSTIAATSPDGITWTQRVLPVSANWYSVTYGNGVFVAVAQSSTIAATSLDGITWTQRALPTSTNWQSVTYGNGAFVAVAYSSTIAANTPSILTYNRSTQFAVPAPAGQVGIKQYIKAL